jgi:ferredoxin
MSLRYLSNVVTLEYDLAKCTGCGLCVDVCPHAIFSMDVQSKKAVLGDRDLEFETTPLQVGGSTLITVSGDYILENGQISVYVGNYEDIGTSMDHQEWDRVWHFHSFYRTEDGIQTGITIPEFLPMNDQEYSIFVSFSDDDMGTNTHYNVVTIHNGESGKSTIVEEEGGDDPDSIPVIGFAGIINEMLDRVLLKYLLPYDPQTNMKMLGIYSACYKLSILMTLFIQAFRYAAEPFFFAYSGNSDARTVYANVLKFFVIFCVFIFLLVTLFINFFKYTCKGFFTHNNDSLKIFLIVLPAFSMIIVLFINSISCL